MRDPRYVDPPRPRDDHEDELFLENDELAPPPPEPPTRRSGGGTDPLRSPRPLRERRRERTPEAEDRPALRDSGFLRHVDKYGGKARFAESDPTKRAEMHDTYRGLMHEKDALLDTYGEKVFDALEIPLDTRKRKAIGNALERDVVHNPERVHEHLDRHQTYRELEREIPQLKEELGRMRSVETLLRKDADLRKEFEQIDRNDTADFETVKELYAGKEKNLLGRWKLHLGFGVSPEQKAARKRLKNRYGIGFGLAKAEGQAWFEQKNEERAENRREMRADLRAEMQERERVGRALETRERNYEQTRVEILAGVMADRDTAQGMEAAVKTRMWRLMNSRDPRRESFSAFKDGQEYFENMVDLAGDLRAVSPIVEPPSDEHPEGRRAGDASKFLETDEKVAALERVLLARARTEIESIVRRQHFGDGTFDALRETLQKFVDMERIGRQDGDGARQVAIGLLRQAQDRISDSGTMGIKKMLIGFMIAEFES